MTQQEYAALAAKATVKKNTFTEVVTQSGTNAVNIEGHTGVLTTLLVNEPPIPGIYSVANAPATPEGYRRLEGNGSVAFMAYDYIYGNIDQTGVHAHAIPDGYAIPSLKYIQFLIDNSMQTGTSFSDGGNWWHWTTDALASGLATNVANIFHVNSIRIIPPFRVNDGARLRLIYIG